MSDESTNADGSAKGSFQNSGGSLGKSRFVVGSDEQLAKAGEEKAPVSPYRTGRQVIRVQSHEDGTVEVLRNERTGGNVQQQAGPTEAFALNALGNKVPLTQAGENTVLDIPGWGTSTAGAYEQMGVVRKLSSGGYEWIGAPQAPSNPAAPQPVQQPETPPKGQEGQPAAVDMANVKGTSFEAEATLKAVQEMAPTQYEGMIAKAAAGQEIDYATVAQEMGVDDGGARVQDMVRQHSEAGAQVLRNMGVDPAVFEKHLLANPDLADKVVRSVMQKDMSVLAQAGREFKAMRQAEIENKVEAAVETQRIDGVLYIKRSALGLSATSPRQGDFGGGSLISLAEAIRIGAVEIAE